MTKSEPRQWKIPTLRAEFCVKLGDLVSFPASQKLPSLEASPKENISRGNKNPAITESVKGCSRREHGNRAHTPSRTSSRILRGFIPTEQPLAFPHIHDFNPISDSGMKHFSLHRKMWEKGRRVSKESWAGDIQSPHLSGFQTSSINSTSSAPWQVSLKLCL